MHIVFVIANNLTVPYFKLFMEEAKRKGSDKFSFVALCKNEPAMIDESKSYGFQGYWIPFDCDKRKSNMIKVLPKLYKLFRKLRPDVVHSHLFDDSVPTLLAAKLARVPVRVITKQDTAFHYYYAPKCVIFDKFNNRNATDVVPVSEEAKDFVINVEKCKTDKITTIDHGIDLNRFTMPNSEEFPALRKKYDLNGKFVIGTVARFIEWKKYRDVIEVATKICKTIPNAKFLLIGSGNQMEMIQNMINERNLQNNVLLTGRIDLYTMQNIYGLMNVYLHTAEMEPFGFVIAEAMVAGLPVVSTPTGAARDAITHKENGWLGKYKNIDSLVEGVQYFHDQNIKIPWNKPQETASKMFDFKRMYADYIELYKKSLTKNK